MTTTDDAEILAEQIVLGSVILNSDLMNDVLEALIPADFSSNSHRLIYSAIRELYDRSEPIELGTIHTVLQAQGQLEKVGGPVALGALIDGITRTDSITYYIGQIKKRKRVNTIARAATYIVDLCLEEPDKPDLVARCQKVFWDACDEQMPNGFIHLGEAAMKYLEIIEDMQGNGGSGLMTGFNELDVRMLGLQKKELTILAGRPSAGKTSFSFHIAQNIAKAKHSVAYFSIEMASERIGEKAISLLGPFDSMRMRAGYLGDDGWKRASEVVSEITQESFLVCDEPGLDAREIKARALKVKRDRGLDLIVVDYLQLMGGNGRDRKFELVGENVMGMKALAKELDVAVLLLSQMNRNIEGRSDGSEPQLSDLGESGEIERVADVVLFVYKSDMENVVNIKIGKNRNGPVGVFQMFYERPFNRFGDLYR